MQKDQAPVAHTANSDRSELPPGTYAFSKCLAHNSLGEVRPESYQALQQALASRRDSDFARLALPGPGKLADPLAAFAYNLEGCDPQEITLPPCPRFGSSEQAADMAEVYWQALTRDVPFSEFERSPLIADAAADLSRLSGFRGPKEMGKITPALLFRGDTPGDHVGPYISQFLWKDVPYGTTLMKQRFRTTVSKLDYMTTYDEWLAVQNGQSPIRPVVYDPTHRYIRNGRDLSVWVYRDFGYQPFLHAALILLDLGLGALDDANPYKRSRTISGFATFGSAQVVDWVARVSNAALKAAWYQKWCVHQRIRPEEFAGRVHHHMTGAKAYPVHADLLNSSVLEVVRKAHGSYLLPMSHPEGCPAHPSYPAGHAAMAGACATVLKAMFQEDALLPDTVEPVEDGTALRPYTASKLTIGGELNKLAMNVSLGRDVAGLHYRSDGTSGLQLGEQVATRLLQDLVHTLPQESVSFRFTSFSGQKITIQKGRMSA